MSNSIYNKLIITSFYNQIFGFSNTFSYEILLCAAYVKMKSINIQISQMDVTKYSDLQINQMDVTKHSDICIKFDWIPC